MLNVLSMINVFNLEARLVRAYVNCLCEKYQKSHEMALTCFLGEMRKLFPLFVGNCVILGSEWVHVIGSFIRLNNF